MENLLKFDQEQAALFPTLHLLGIDEAGRGPLAGPVVAAACHIPAALADQFCQVNDSKKLTEKKREQLFEQLTHTEGILYGIGFASAREIDELNILQATFLAMRRAAEPLMHLPNAAALIDGPHPVAQFTLPQRPIIDGDAKSLAIAAASILAKVTRDRHMKVLEERYPGYGFAEHKGYGTAKHLAALRQLGPCPEHRRSFAPVRRLVTPTLL